MKWTLAVMLLLAIASFFFFNAINEQQSDTITLKEDLTPRQLELQRELNHAVSGEVEEVFGYGNQKGKS